MLVQLITTAVCLFIVYALANTMGLLSSNHMPVNGKTILITGGSEGLGLSAAKQLASKGANIIIVARNISKLESAIKQIKAAAATAAAEKSSSQQQRFLHISADITAPNYARDIISQVTQWNNDQPPDIVWCIAGSSTPMLFAENNTMVETRRQMDVNFFGAAEMAHAILAEWWSPTSTSTRHHPPKHLIFTASVLAFYTIAGYSPYSPAKWALRGLADTLTQEALLYPDQPVKIHVVYPGTILSAGFEREEITKPAVTKALEKDDPRLTPDQVATSAIKGLESGHHFVTVGWLGEAMRWGVMGGSVRNNWVWDTLGAWLIAPVWCLVIMIMHGDIKSWAKKHGHPSTWAKS